MGEFTRAWRARRPEHALVIRSHWFDAVPDKVAAGELDIGLGRMFEAAAHLGVVSLGERPLRLAVPVDHRLAGHREVSLTELNHERILETFGPGWEKYRDRFLDLGRRAGIQLRFVPSPVAGVFGSEILLETSIAVALVFEPAGPAAGGVSVIDLRPPLMVPVLALTDPRIWSPRP
jgi:hypothetical protein